MRKLPEAAVKRLKRQFESEQPGAVDASNKQTTKAYSGPKPDVILKDTKLVQTNRWIEVQ